MKFSCGRESPELCKRLVVYLDSKLLDDEHFAVTSADEETGRVTYWELPADGFDDSMRWLKTGELPNFCGHLPEIIVAHGRVEIKGCPWEWDWGGDDVPALRFRQLRLGLAKLSRLFSFLSPRCPPFR